MIVRATTTIRESVHYVNVICYCCSQNISEQLLFNCFLYSCLVNIIPPAFPDRTWEFTKVLQAGCIWGFCSGNTRLLITSKISSYHFYATVTCSQSSHVIGEFQREVPLRVYFSQNCRSTPVHLLMRVSLRHSSQAKLRSSHIQGLWKSQVPPFLKKKITSDLHKRALLLY